MGSLTAPQQIDIFTKYGILLRSKERRLVPEASKDSQTHRSGAYERAGEQLHMSLINMAKREINCKIVYYGIGLCGKTTNLHYIHQAVNPQDVGDMVSI